MNLTQMRRELDRLQTKIASQVVRKTIPDFLQFIRLCSIRDEEGTWIPFNPWPAQEVAALTLTTHRLNIWLKARQLGLTWLALAFALWTALEHPGCTVLLFSRRDQEAVELLDRVRGMFARLPADMQYRIVQSNTHIWQMANGARVLSFPTTAGDSYTAKLAIVDEADLVPDLDRLMGAVKPTIDAGGSMLLLSRVDKSKPGSRFKTTYQSAVAKTSDWNPTFLPWSARPDRDELWYAAQRRDVMGRTGCLDQLYEQYPSTDAEALAPNQLDKRIPIEWIYAQLIPSAVEADPEFPNVRFFVRPQPERRYAIGADPAEGNPNSDPSGCVVLDADTGEQCAEVNGRIELGVFANLIATLSKYYNNAPTMPERNNHGHAIIAALREADVTVLTGHDGKFGWLSSGKGKVLLYDGVVEALREGTCWVRSTLASTQLASIEGATLRAPEGAQDDIADAYALAVAAMNHPQAKRRPVKIG